MIILAEKLKKNLLFSLVTPQNRNDVLVELNN